MPKDDKRKELTQEEIDAQNEKFRTFFSTSVAQVPEEMKRRDEEKENTGSLLGKLFLPGLLFASRHCLLPGKPHVVLVGLAALRLQFIQGFLRGAVPFRLVKLLAIAAPLFGPIFLSLRVLPCGGFFLCLPGLLLRPALLLKGRFGVCLLRLKLRCVGVRLPGALLRHIRFAAQHARALLRVGARVARPGAPARAIPAAAAVLAVPACSSFRPWTGSCHIDSMEILQKVPTSLTNTTSIARALPW